MKLHRVRPAFAVVVFAAGLAACGGGGGTGGPPPPPPPPPPTATPVPTNTPGTGYVAPTGNVTQLGPSNKFGSSMLTASTDGTFVVQSADTPAEPGGNTPTLTEYDVSASQSAAGQVPGARTRVTGGITRVASSAGRSEGAASVMPYRPRLDPRSDSLRLKAFHGRSPLQVVRGGRTVASVRRAQAVLNQQQTMHVQQGVITGVSGSCTPPNIQAGTSCYKDVSTHLLYISNHAYVWVDDNIDASYNLGATDWKATGDTFDADYARETAAFAPAFIPGTTNTYQQCDANGTQLPQPPAAGYKNPVDLSGTDPHISILITNALESTGEGGYFDFINLINDQEINCAEHPHVPSNNLPMFVIGTDKYQLGSGLTADENYWRNQDMPRSVPHEFQHYLHALNKVLKADLASNCTNPNGCGEFDDSFVDEGDSMLAEDLVQPGNAQSQDSQLLAFDYLYNPANFSLTAFTGYDANPLDTSQNPAFGFYRFTGGNYGEAYLFARYLYDRFGGDAALQRVYADLTTNGTQTTANTHPISSEANGETFGQVYGEFAAALAARNVASTDPRFKFSPAVFLRGTKTVAIPGGQTWDMVENGPRSPDDLTSTHPLATGSTRIKLTPNSSVTAKLITGATLYFNVAPAGGSVVSATITGAPPSNVNGALVQGPYDDTGSCLGPASSGC